MGENEPVDAQTVSRVMSALGSIKSERKAASSRANGKLRPQVPIEQIECTCGAGGAPLSEHKAVCRRRRTVAQRERRARVKQA